MNIDRNRIFQFFKYFVYALLTLNIYLFFAIEWAASAHRFADGIYLADIIEGIAASIDTAAWVILLLMFELETYVLDDQQFTKRVTWSLHGLRAICYAFIFLAAVYWGVKGDFVDFWDAFLWLVAFVFIELNVVEWRQESAESQDFAVSCTP